jgi:hypothetical protein
MFPWIECPSLDLDLSLSFAERFRELPEELLDRSRQLLQAVQREISGSARWLAPMVHLRTANRFRAEAVAMAQRVGVDWRDLTLANLSYELVVGLFACSTVVLPTSTGPVLARNMDFWPEQWLARASALIRFRRGGQPAFVNAGWPGAIGAVSGMSSRGFAIVLNAVGAGIHKLGYPVLLHLRRVLEDADSFDVAVQWLSREKLAAGALFTVAGTENDQRVVVERTPTEFALRRPNGDEPLVTTNDFRLLGKSATHSDHELLATSCSRFDSLCRFFGSHRPSDSVEDTRLLYALTEPSIRQSITAQHMIFRPREQSARLFAPRDLVEGVPST